MFEVIRYIQKAMVKLPCSLELIYKTNPSDNLNHILPQRAIFEVSLYLRLDDFTPNHLTLPYLTLQITLAMFPQKPVLIPHLFGLHISKALRKQKTGEEPDNRKQSKSQHLPLYVL